MPSAICYTRVSTSKQGQSGLGLEAQQAAVDAFCTQHGFEIAGRYSEVETGKGADALDRRPVLGEASVCWPNAALLRRVLETRCGFLGCRWPTIAAARCEDGAGACLIARQSAHHR